MNDVIEVDLRRVIRVLLSKVLWITGFAVLVGLSVLVYLISQPRMADATAIVALSEPRDLIDFDRTTQSSQNQQIDNKMAMDIAQSQELEIFIFNAWNSPDKQKMNWSVFAKNNLSVKAGNAAKVLVLTVSLDSQEEAARLANMWADKVVERLNTLSVGQYKSQLSAYEGQIKTASDNMSKAQTALAEFEGRNTEHALEAQLDALMQQQKSFLQRQQLIASLQRDAKALLKEVENLPGTTTLPAETQTRLLALQLRLYSDTAQVQTAPQPSTSSLSSSVSTNDTPSSVTIVSPFQYQLPAVSGSQPVSVTDFRGAVQGWLTALDGQSTEIATLLKDYPQNLATFQKQIETLNEEKQRLTIDASVASDTYTALTRKYQETSINAKDSVGMASIAARAYPKVTYSLVKNLAYAAVALVAAAVLAATFVLFMDWWKWNINSKP